MKSRMNAGTRRSPKISGKPAGRKPLALGFFCLLVDPINPRLDSRSESSDYLAQGDFNCGIRMVGKDF